MYAHVLAGVDMFHVPRPQHETLEGSAAVSEPLEPSCMHTAFYF